MTATHIRNRCYSQRLKNTLYGAITGMKPDVTKMQIFGSTCYPTVQNPKKLEPRSKKGIFVGYDRDSPSYLVYDPDTRAISKHRLVKLTSTDNRMPESDTDQPIPVSEEQTIKSEELAPVNLEPRKSYPLRSRQQSKDETESSDVVNYIDYFVISLF